MKRKVLRYSIGIFLLLCLSLMLGCVTAPPSNVDNICQIFREKGGWYKAAKSAQQEWGPPIPVLMAFIHQESRFRAKAKPPRRKILWFIPGPRLSSAYGYSQAKDSTWDWYRKDSGNRGADRDDFDDAVDFVAWYNYQSHKRNGIAMNDAYNLYLAFHEGHGGYTRRSYKNKDWLKNVALRVSSRSNRYTTQLQKCEDELNSPWWWPF